MISSLQLDLRFDLASLQRDLERVEPGEWVAHYNTGDYVGDWQGAALRSVLGKPDDLAAGGSAFADTPLLERCPYFRHVLSCFDCPLRSVRLLRLAPASFIREHSDPDLGFEHGEVRLHIPIQLDPGVEFYSAGEALKLDEGSCYYINASLPHRVIHRGVRTRVHLVIDAEVNDWLRTLFAHGKPVERLESTVLGRFRNAVLHDPSLQEKLHAIPDRDTYVKEAVRAGRNLGFEVNEGDVERLDFMHPEAPPGRDWVPVRLHAADSNPAADWVYFGGRRFEESFFADTVRAALRNPFARAFRHKAPLDEADGPAPAGLIFHMTRCGSTLAARMLAALPKATVISEAQSIDDAIQSRRPELLCRVAAALRRDEGPCFIKLDAWHIHALPLLRAAFPETPWIFLYRDPLEVLVSQLLSPGQLALRGAMDPAVLKLRFEDVTALNPEEWCARIVAGLCESAMEFRNDPLGRFVNYRELPEGFLKVVAEHFSVSLTALDVEGMRAAARYDAKSQGVVFEPDSQRKREAASERVRKLAEEINPLYQALCVGID